MLVLMEDTHILNCDRKNGSLLFCYCDVSLSSSLSLLNQFSARHKDEKDDASLGISEFTAAPVGVPRRYSDAKKVCVCLGGEALCGEEDGGKRYQRVDEKQS